MIHRGKENNSSTFNFLKVYVNLGIFRACTWKNRDRKYHLPEFSVVLRTEQVTIAQLGSLHHTNMALPRAGILSRTSPQVSAHGLPFRRSLTCVGLPSAFQKSLQISFMPPGWERRNLKPPALLAHQTPLLTAQTAKKRNLLFPVHNPTHLTPIPEGDR